MADFKIHKVVSALPGTLEADTIYLVRTGSGFDLYVSDTTGSVAYKVNPNQTWTSAGGGLVYFTPNPVGGSLTIEGYGDSGVTESFRDQRLEREFQLHQIRQRVDDVPYSGRPPHAEHKNRQRREHLR